MRQGKNCLRSKTTGKQASFIAYWRLWHEEAYEKSSAMPCLGVVLLFDGMLIDFVSGKSFFIRS